MSATNALTLKLYYQTRWQSVIDYYMRKENIEIDLHLDLTNIIFSYLMPVEYFSDCGPTINIADNTHAIAEKMANRGAVFGLLDIPSTEPYVYKWWFTVKGVAAMLCIGVIDTIKKRNPSRSYSNTNVSFGINCFSGSKISAGGYQKYAVMCRDSDLCMTLNMIEKNLSFAVEGVDYGAAFEGLSVGADIEYKLAISMSGRAIIDTGDFVRTEVKLTNFECWDVNKYNSEKKEKTAQKDLILPL